MHSGIVRRVARRGKPSLATVPGLDALKRGWHELASGKSYGPTCELVPLTAFAIHCARGVQPTIVV